MDKKEFDSVHWSTSSRIRLRKGLNGGRYSERVFAVDFQLRRVKCIWKYKRWWVWPFLSGSRCRRAQWYNYTQILEVKNDG